MKVLNTVVREWERERKKREFEKESNKEAFELESEQERKKDRSIETYK